MNEENFEAQENSAQENKTSASSKKKLAFIIGGAVVAVDAQIGAGPGLAVGTGQYQQPGNSTLLPAYVIQPIPVICL